MPIMSNSEASREQFGIWMSTRESQKALRQDTLSTPSSGESTSAKLFSCGHEVCVRDCNTLQPTNGPRKVM